MEFKDVDGYYLPAEVDKYVDEQQAEINDYKEALESIVGQTDDQYVDGVWREVNTTAQQALDKHKGG